MVGLTAAQKKFYEDNGYIVVKNLLSKEELQEISDEYDNIFKRKNQEIMEQSWVGQKDDAIRVSYTGWTVKGVHNLQLHHSCFGKFMGNEKLLDVLEDVMGTKNIMLHHTKAHFKPPEKGAEYPMHQDYHYFPYKRHSPVAMFLHLDAANPENGGLHVYPGSHKLGPQEDKAHGHFEEGGYHIMDKNKFPMSGATPVIAEQGDVVIFSYLLVHGSSLNTSTRPRRMFLTQYISADDEMDGEQRTQPGYGWLFRGVNVNKDECVANRFNSK